MLEEIGASEIPQLLVYNKVDLLDQPPRILRDGSGMPIAVYLSAREGTGMELLAEALLERLQENVFAGDVQVGPSDGRLRASLYSAGAVQKEVFAEDGGSILTIRLPQKDWERLQHKH